MAFSPIDAIFLALLPLGFFLLGFLFEPPSCCHLPRQGPQGPTLGPALIHGLSYQP